MKALESFLGDWIPVKRSPPQELEIQSSFGPKFYLLPDQLQRFYQVLWQFPDSGLLDQHGGQDTIVFPIDTYPDPRFSESPIEGFLWLASENQRGWDVVFRLENFESPLAFSEVNGNYEPEFEDLEQSPIDFLVTLAFHELAFQGCENPLDPALNVEGTFVHSGVLADGMTVRFERLGREYLAMITETGELYAVGEPPLPLPAL